MDKTNSRVVTHTSRGFRAPACFIIVPVLHYPYINPSDGILQYGSNAVIATTFIFYYGGYSTHHGKIWHY